MRLVHENASLQILNWYCIMIQHALDGTKEQFEIAKQELLTWYVCGSELYIPEEEKPDCIVVEDQIKFAVHFHDDYPEDERRRKISRNIINNTKSY